jgi:hypothetical protein
MRNWKARLLALLTAVAMLLAVSGPAAIADDDWDEDDGYYYGWYGYYPYYLGLTQLGAEGREAWPDTASPPLARSRASPRTNSRRSLACWLPISRTLEEIT